MKADKRIGFYVEAGTVLAAHLRGRLKDGESTWIASRHWTVERMRDFDDRLLFTLLAVDEDSERPLMCSKCGSFDLDRTEIDDPWCCTSCHHRGPARGVLV